MLCDRCGKHEANVVLKRSENGSTRELHLCSRCAQESGLMQAMEARFDHFFDRSFFRRPNLASAMREMSQLLGSGDPFQAFQTNDPWLQEAEFLMKTAGGLPQAQPDEEVPVLNNPVRERQRSLFPDWQAPSEQKDRLTLAFEQLQAEKNGGNASATEAGSGQDASSASQSGAAKTDGEASGEEAQAARLNRRLQQIAREKQQALLAEDYALAARLKAEEEKIRNQLQNGKPENEENI